MTETLAEEDFEILRIKDAPQKPTSRRSLESIKQELKLIEQELKEAESNLLIKRVLEIMESYRQGQDNSQAHWPDNSMGHL